MRLYYYQIGLRYSPIKSCEVKEFPNSYKVVDNGTYGIDFIPVSVIKKSNMNTYDYYFFTSYEEAVKSIVKAMKETVDNNCKRIKELCEEIDYYIERINKYEANNECL